MAFTYNQLNPVRGAQQYQLGALPMQGYQQQLPSGTGQDFYASQAMGGDPRLYQNTTSRLSSGLGGVGKYEAKLWHHRAYSGHGEVTRMTPQEIGFAAAYEAYRKTKHSISAYTDYEQQREAQRGLAMAEAARLWQNTGRGMDQYSSQMACEAAAATAANIAAKREQEGYGTGLGSGSSRSRRNSFGGYSAPGYAGSAGYGGGSAYGGNSPLPMGMGRSRQGSPIPPGPIPIPGSPRPDVGRGFPYAGSSGMPGSYGGGGGYAGSQGTPGYDYQGLQNAGGYPVGGYASSPAPGTTIIYQPPPDHHRSRHRSRHRHRRHRSQDRY